MAKTGSVVVVPRADVTDLVSRPVRQYSFNFTTDAASGDVTNQAVGADAAGIPVIVSGNIERAVFVPGSPAPTNTMTAAILDANGIDVLSGLWSGGNTAPSGGGHVKPGVPMKDGTTTTTAPIAVDEGLILQVGSAGNSKKGSIILYVR